MEEKESKRDHRGRDYLLAAIGVVVELAALIWGVYAFSIGASFLLLLAAYEYTKEALGKRRKLARYFLRIVAATVITIAMLAIPYLKQHATPKGKRAAPFLTADKSPTPSPSPPVPAAASSQYEGRAATSGGIPRKKSQKPQSVRAGHEPTPQKSTQTGNQKPEFQINSAPNGIAIGGGNVNNPTVYNFAPPSWHLTAEQVIKFREIATTLPASVRVMILRANDTNSLLYGSEIYKIFESMGKAKPTDILTAWEWRDGVIPQGIFVFVNNGRDIAFPIAQEIASVLLSSGICPVAFSAKDSLKEGEIQIIIGIRPQP